MNENKYKTNGFGLYDWSIVINIEFVYRSGIFILQLLNFNRVHNQKFRS